MRVHDEALMFGNLIVQRAPGLIGGLCLPIDARTFGEPGCFVHRVNQEPTDAKTTKMLSSEKVLQITDISQTSSASMKQEVRQADNTAGLFGY
jgi:hypothetical protein